MKITFTFNGLPLEGESGQSVSAALIANGERIARYSRFNGAPRGAYCGIGICFDCVLIIDGLANQRSCLTEIADGMKVETQR